MIKKIFAKTLLIIVALAMLAAPILSMARPAHASRAGSATCPNGPVLYSRTECTGYFTGTDVYVNGWGVFGDQVIWNNGAALFPVNNANDFINLMGGMLWGGNPDDVQGAAFTIDTMLGSWGWDFGTVQAGVDHARNVFNIWVATVRYYDANGWVNWNQYVNYWAPFQNSLLSRWVAREDIFYMKQQNESQWTIVFNNPNGSNYMIKKNCGNLVGSPTGLYIPPMYQINGRTTVSTPTVLPGGFVSFSSFLNNSGPDFAPNISFNHKDAATGNPIVSGNTGLPPGEYDVADEALVVPPGTPFGTNICRFVDFAPASNGIGYGAGPPTCTQVVAQYSLTPTVTVNSPTAQQNDTVTFTYAVNNSGPTQSDNVSCTEIGNTRPSGYAPLPQQDVARTADPGYVPPGDSCPQVFSPGSTNIATETVNVGNLAPGQLLCRSLVVNPRDQNGGPRTSAETCVVIAKTPYVRFLGGDVWAGGGFSEVGNCTNASNIHTVQPHQLSDSSVAGSVSEYGAFALGAITNFGTASKALFGAQGKALTFSNMLNDGSLGKYGAPQHCVNDFISAFNNKPVDNPAQPASINLAIQGSGTWHLSGDRTFSGAVQTGSQQIYLVDGNVTISNDITFPATYSGPGDIPLLMIIAKGSINVLGNVKQMDGVYSTADVLHTCDQHVGTLTVNTCNQQLIVNGAVVAKQLNLRRTYGADGNAPIPQKQPGEIFNMNAELFLRNNLNDASSSLTIRTVQTMDLPPRY